MPRAMSFKSSIAAKRKRATIRQDRADAALRSFRTDVAASRSSVKSVLVVDVGGTSVKILATGQTEVRSFRSGPTLTPRRMVSGVKKLAADWTYDVVSIGYPGPVLGGRPIAEAYNLGRGWVGFDFAQAFGRPVKVVNDAAMQALGSYNGGKMLFLGLGTGLGTAMIVEGIVAPMDAEPVPKFILPKQFRQLAAPIGPACPVCATTTREAANPALGSPVTSRPAPARPPPRWSDSGPGSPSSRIPASSPRP